MTSSGHGNDHDAAAVNRRDESGAIRHNIEIANPSYVDGYTAVCSCGWSSEEMATTSAATRKGIRHLQEVGANGR